MRALLLTYDYPPTVGGIANILATFFRLGDSGGSVIVAPQSPGAREFDHDHPVPTVRFPSPSGPGLANKGLSFVWAALWTLIQLLQHRPQVVIAGQLARAGPILYAWSVLTRTPLYVWVYGGETKADFTGLSIFTRMLHGILRRARVVFTNSPYTSQEMLDFGLAAERVVELPRGVDRSVLFPTPKDATLVEELGLADKLVFMTLGRLVERKGVDTMLRALAELDDELPPWRYVVVSDGPYRATLEEMIHELGLREKVIFTGYIERDELPVYYNLCDVFAMPNRAVISAGGNTYSVEGFGTVFIEAAACGKPVIAGRSGGAVYAVDDETNGYVVDPDGVEDLKRVLRLLTQPQRREQMGRAGLEFVQRFSWERSAAILSSFLENCPPNIRITTRGEAQRS